MKKTGAFVVASFIALSSPAEAMTQAQTDNAFDFAVMRTSRWVLTATTNVRWGDFPARRSPTVESVECTGESAQFAFSMSESGSISWLRAKFLGDAGENGEQEEITLLGDRIWLYLDGERWEFANVATHPRKFSNIPYPPPESDIILTQWLGHQAVRRAEDQPWINLSLLYYRLITAKRIEWSYKSRDWTVVDKKNAANRLPENWQTTRYRIDNEGLHDAIFWCARQVSSEKAYILPPTMSANVNALRQKR